MLPIVSQSRPWKSVVSHTSNGRHGRDRDEMMTVVRFCCRTGDDVTNRRGPPETQLAGSRLRGDVFVRTFLSQVGGIHSTPATALDLSLFCLVHSYYPTNQPPTTSSQPWLPSTNSSLPVWSRETICLFFLNMRGPTDMRFPLSTARGKKEGMVVSGHAWVRMRM